jgi:hypothetical protein
MYLTNISVVFNSSHFGGLQYEKLKNGRKESSMAALTFYEFQSLDIFTADGDNLANRITGLIEIRYHNPKAFSMVPFFKLQFADQKT